MTIRWVKFKTNNATQVSTEECQNVDAFIKACKKDLSPLLDSYAPAQLCLSTTDGGTPLQPDDSIPAQNTAKTPLFITANDTSPRLKSSWAGTIYEDQCGGFLQKIFGCDCYKTC